ncbi:hypothetical protein BV25DRAFT_1552681 [Artomyces pyxidatus]|uniref:Uncharacterized protein n=1 Tax=Artomyces pyxidatus TaxID=48021 RepID=A0ACB8SKR3_9AGAM|nr:hypothetical protein BV25DRAFT_1552681 [Artomyces pyxidatus]
MSALLHSYTALSSSSSRTDVSKALQAIIDAPLTAFDERARRELMTALLDDLNLCKGSSSSSGRLTHFDAAQALLALKSLGKHPAGARVLATTKNLSDLLAFTKAFKDNQDAALEALRCVANTAFLVEAARQTVLEDSVGGGEAAVQILEKSSNPDHLFIASRILFLCTVSSASASAFIISLVETKPASRTMAVIDIIAMRLDSLTSSILGGVKMAREAMTDLLKFTFNILLHYPKLVDCERVTDLGNGDGKVLGEYWSDRLDGIVAPLLRAFNSLPPTFPSPLAPPLSHIIHSLIATPITASLLSIWFPSTPGRRSSSNSNSNPGSPVHASSEAGPSTPKESKQGAFDRAFSRLTVGRRSLSSRPSSPSPSSPHADTVLRALDLLEVSFSHYLPGAVDVDDASVRQIAKDEGDSTLDELLCPLVLLVMKLATADIAARDRVRELLLPANLDRSAPLEGRADLLGRCLRLLASVYHPRLKDSCGELLFIICNQDATALMAQVGYGNVAGYLFNKGIVTGPPGGDGPALTTPSGAQINPITGAVQEPREEVEMTEEEREAEAERLFVLFDRLERSGAMPPSSNPIRRAVAEGRFG